MLIADAREGHTTFNEAMMLMSMRSLSIERRTGRRRRSVSRRSGSPGIAAPGELAQRSDAEHYREASFFVPYWLRLTRSSAACIASERCRLPMRTLKIPE